MEFIQEFRIPEVIFGRSSIEQVGYCAQRVGAEKVFHAILLPYVMEYNLPDCVEKFVKIAEALGQPTQNKGNLVRKKSDWMLISPNG